MEPGEKFIRRLLRFVFMILAFIVAIVFGEFYRGNRLDWSVDFYNRSFNGRTGHVFLEGFEKLSENDVGVGLHRFCSRLAGDSVGACGVSLEKMGTNMYTRKSLRGFYRRPSVSVRSDSCLPLMLCARRHFHTRDNTVAHQSARQSAGRWTRHQ